MDRLFMRIVDGQPFEHPIMEGNFRDALPEIDPDNLPSGFALFERVNAPLCGIYEVYEGVSYQYVNGVWKDVHSVRDMTEQEIKEKQGIVKEEWADFGFSTWVFNDETCSFIPPVPMPDDGNSYNWNDETVSWGLSQPIE